MQTTKTAMNWTEKLVFVLASAFILLFLGTALARLTYPYELEWMEGAMVDGVLRLLEGKQLYVQPSIEYIPFIYPPLYFYLSAAVSLLISPGFLPMRLVSILSTLGTLILVHRITSRETNSCGWGLAAAGLYAATYAQVDAWFDISRVDPLAILLLLGAVYLIRFHNSIPAGISAGLLLSLAFLTKQASLVAAMPLLLYWFLQKRSPTRWSLPLTFLGISAAGLLLFSILTDGWFFYYTFSLPGQHPILPEMLCRFWIDLLKPMAIAAMLSLLFILFLLQNKQKEQAGFYFALLAGFIGASYLGRLHPNAHINVLMSSFASLAIVAPQGYLALMSSYQRENINPGTSGGWKKSAFSIAFLLQFLLLLYNPLRYIPDRNDRMAGGNLMSAIQSYQGDVYLPYHGYLSTMASKGSSAHAMAVSDVLAGTDSSAASALRSSMQSAFQQQQFEALILDSNWMESEWQDFYNCEAFTLPEGSFWPRTGMQTRPNRICIRRP
ncbi:MAG: glycosyltransferase family 39 protein [Anaerolineales bacterium]|nr:glycosyltransferase family 39 protein [Anaerolineales bacterium]